MYLIECSVDNSLTILENSDVICDHETVEVGDVIKFVYRKKSYEGIVRSYSEREEDLEKEMKVLKECAKKIKKSQETKVSSKLGKRERTKPRSYSPSQYDEPGLKKKRLSATTIKKSQEDSNRIKKKNKLNNSDFEVSSGDENTKEVTPSKKSSLKDDSTELSSDASPEISLKERLNTSRILLQKQLEHSDRSPSFDEGEAMKKSPKRVILISPEHKVDDSKTKKKTDITLQRSPEKSPIPSKTSSAAKQLCFPPVDDDFQLYGPTFDNGNMVHLQDGIYCRKKVYQSAINGSNAATGLARKLLSGVIKPEYLLRSSICGQAPRSQGRERQKADVICLHPKARQAITEYAKAYARSQENWSSATPGQITSSLRQKLTEIRLAHKKNSEKNTSGNKN